MVVTNGAVITTGGAYEIYDNDRGEGNNARIEVDVLETNLYHIDVFTDGAAGTYTVVVTRTSDEVQINSHIHGPNTAGNSVSEPIEQDLPSSTSTTGYIEPDGEPATGNIDNPNDPDLFKTHLVAGQSYQFDVKGAEPTDQGGTLDDPAIVLTANSNSPLSSNTDRVSVTLGNYATQHIGDTDSGRGSNARLRITVHKTGTYHAGILHQALSGTGTYEITLKNITPRGTPQQTVPEFDGLDYPNKSYTKGYLQADGDAATGEIKWVGDRDMYRMQVQKDEHYLLTVTGDTLSDPLVELRDEFENRIWNEHNSHEASQLNWSPDTHWTDAEGDSDSSGLLLFKSKFNGELFASVSGGNGTGTYSVKLEQTDSVSEPDGEDFPTANTTQGYITTNGKDVTGNLDDVMNLDSYRIDLKAGRYYRIEVRGNPTGDGTLVDPYVYLNDSDHNRVSDSDTGVEQTNESDTAGNINNDDLSGTNVNARLDLLVHESGTYYVTVSGGTGTYRIVTTSWFAPQGSMATVSEGTTDLPDTTSTTGYVQVSGTPATGQITSVNDQDWFKVDLVAGQTYRVDLKGDVGTDYGGTLPDPGMFMYDPDGNPIESTDITPIVGILNENGFVDFDGGTGNNAKMEFKAKISGTYHIQAGEEFGHQGTYTLVVTRLD